MSSKELFVNNYDPYHNKPATVVEEPLLAAPRIVINVLCLFSLAMLFKFFVMGSGMFPSMVAFVPLQLYWSFCLFRLSNIIGAKCGIKPPLSETNVFLITVTALVCLPRFDSYPIGLYTIDAFFWLWMVTQLIGPLVLGIAIQREALKQKQAANLYILPTTLALIANSYLLLLFVPAPAFFSVFFLSAWTVGQFVALSALNFRLRSVFSQDVNLVKMLKAKSAASAFLSSDYQLGISYRGFAGLEKWLKERFSGSSNDRTAKIIAGSVLAPFLLAATFFCLIPFINFNTLLFPQVSTGTVQAVAIPTVVKGTVLTLSLIHI